MHLVGCGVVVVIVVYNLGFNDGHRSFQLGYSPIFQRSLVIHTYRWPQIQVQRDPPLNVGSWWPLCGMVLQLVVRLWCATGTSPSGRYWTLCWVGSIASLWGFWCHAGIEAPFSMVPSPWGWGFFTSHPLFWPSMWKLTSTFFLLLPTYGSRTNLRFGSGALLGLDRTSELVRLGGEFPVCQFLGGEIRFGLGTLTLRKLGFMIQRGCVNAFAAGQSCGSTGCC